MKKKIALIMAMLSVVFALSGCGKDYLPDISDEELENCKQYAVNLLLKYNKGYSSNLLSDEAAAAQQEKIMAKAELQAEVKAKKEEAAKKRQEEAENEKDKNGSSDGDNQEAPVYSDIDEFLGLSGIQIECTGYSISDSYPTELGENDFQGVVRAGSGNKLIVVNFSIVNNSGVDYDLNIPSYGIKSVFKINGSKTKVPLSTILFDDFYNCAGVINAGETKNTVLLIEVSESDAQALSSIRFILKAGGNKMETTIL